MRRIKRISLLIACLISFAAISCKEDTKAKENKAKTTETASTKAVKTNKSKTSELKYNPEHGKEGHRCDLPVGAPLDKASASNTPEMTSSPVRLKSATPRINPPHGEPGHDCSVPVGGELN